MTSTNDSATRIVTLPPISVLGVGALGGAIVRGLCGPQVQRTGSIRITNRSAAAAAQFADNPAVTASAVELDPQANRAAVRGARIVIVAVKPWMVHDLLSEIAGDLSEDAIVVSVAAGVTSASMEALLPESVSVIRAMPNTPAHIGRALTGLSHGSRSSATDMARVRQLFGTVGEVMIVGEEQINALSAISGSGPAYLFWFAEQLTAAAEHLGFTGDEAKRLVNATLSGASELLRVSEDDARELRRQVTSPNGTTERAIAVFEQEIPDAVFSRAVQAAVDRSEELAAQ